MTAYYNEIDPKAAQWLRNLIEAGHIAPGYVDERSIEDVYPSDLRGFTQCHFFAGIGVWSYALRSAGWADDRPVWTGSCPCQPFSAAGKGTGFDDERHLWPAFHHLIKECKPECILGEQVASKDAGPWIDLVHTDLEALGYAFGAVPFPSAGVGAPHIRDRLYWVANANCELRDWAGIVGEGRWVEYSNSGAARGLANCNCDGCQQGSERGETMGHGQAPGAGRGIGGMADTVGGQHQSSSAQPDQRPVAGSHGALQAQRTEPGPTNGYWADADWFFCRDGKWRPVEPGTFPLANGASARVGRLRAYGNAINAAAAEEFISAYLEA